MENALDFSPILNLTECSFWNTLKERRRILNNCNDNTLSPEFINQINGICLSSSWTWNHLFLLLLSSVIKLKLSQVSSTKLKEIRNGRAAANQFVRWWRTIKCWAWGTGRNLRSLSNESSQRQTGSHPAKETTWADLVFRVHLPNHSTNRVDPAAKDLQ